MTILDFPRDSITDTPEDSSKEEPKDHQEEFDTQEFIEMSLIYLGESQNRG